MLIDFHTHTQPSRRDAEDFFGWVKRPTPADCGTVEELFENMARLEISRTLIVPWMPAQDLVKARIEAGEPRAEAVRGVLDRWKELNGWAARTVAEHPDRLSCLVGLDPILMERAEMEREVAERLEQGACGLKIAPMFLDVPPSDAAVSVVWELARRHGVFVLSECGARPAHGHEAWGHPRYFHAVLQAYPDVRVMLAHLGQGAEEEVARLTHAYPNVYADLSLRLSGIDQPGGWTSRDLVALIRRIGADRVVYGTNYPLIDPAAYVETFAALDLTADEREKIAWRNAQSLLARR